MRITRLIAKNYKTLEDLELTFEQSFCTLSGKNNSGKSSVIRLLMNLFLRDNGRLYYLPENEFSYKDDKTQWVKADVDITIKYEIELSKTDDLLLVKFIEKMADHSTENENLALRIEYNIDAKDQVLYSVFLDGIKIEDDSAKEVIERIRNSNMLFLHNSTSNQDDLFFIRGGGKSFYEMVISPEEQKQLEAASKTVQQRINQLAKEHKKELNRFLGKLNDKYDVDFTTLNREYGRRVPFSINLNDKNVEIPLCDWGSGTKNRTFILMSVLQANKMKNSDPIQDRITPVVIVEEPESFLHPSAQAEFGNILRELSEELGIQIIATTHSPYMLNQKNPSANILLSRTCQKGQNFKTEVVSTENKNWMAPFADHLGVSPNEFYSWHQLFSTTKSKVLLVEGEIDKEYFEYIRTKKIGTKRLSEDIEIVAYGGKDALKNTLLVKFVLSKFDNVFITYDLDASNDVKGSLARLNLKEKDDYIAIGVNKPGRDAIEGLLPNRILSAVQAKETDLVMALTSADSAARKSAKSNLKQKYLEEFKKYNDYSNEELSELDKIWPIINKKMK